MLNVMAQNWWLVVLRGVAAVIFGILAYIWPGITLASLVLLFGVYALIDGAFTLGSSIMNKNVARGGEVDRPRGLLILEGLVGIAAGIVTFIWPAITAIALLYLIAAWALFTGVLEIAEAIRLRREIKNEWLLGLSGVLSVLFGLALMFWPAAGALAVVWMIGAYAIMFGVLLTVLGFRMRGFQAGGDRSPYGKGGQFAYR